MKHCAPPPAFPAMDFATRDEYRNQVELLSQGSGRSEIELAQRGRASGTGMRNPGETAPTFLPRWRPIHRGASPEAPWCSRARRRGPRVLPRFPRDRRDFERRLGFRVRLRLQLQRAYHARAIAGYLGGIVTLTALQLCSLLFITWFTGAGPWILVLLATVGLVPASDIAISLIHRLVAALLPPTRLPKLELAQGVPPELRTVIAVPTLLASHADIERAARTTRGALPRQSGGPSPLHPSLPTGRTRPVSACPATRSSLPRWPTASTASMRGTKGPPGSGRSGSFCCTAGVSGTRGKTSGSAGRGSEASSTS